MLTFEAIAKFRGQDVDKTLAIGVSVGSLTMNHAQWVTMQSISATRMRDAPMIASAA